MKWKVVFIDEFMVLRMTIATVWMQETLLPWKSYNRAVSNMIVLKTTCSNLDRIQFGFDPSKQKNNKFIFLKKINFNLNKFCLPIMFK